jgi:uncharacterized protein
MILHIEQLQKSTKLCFDVTNQQCNLPSDIGTFKTPIHFNAHVRKVDEEISIEGRISAHLEMLCSRCLKPHDEYIDETFEVVYRPYSRDKEETDEIELDETDLNISYYEGEVIDTLELIREQLLLFLPVKPLCKDDCAGLCPTCGKDLNEGPCSCTHETIDPRLAVLKQFLQKETSEK